MKIGYLRVSTEDQNPARQVDALEGICDQLYIEKLSAVAKKRPVFDHVMKCLHAGDTLVVWDLDRAFRSTLDALQQSKNLQSRNIAFQIVTMNIDTSEPMGECFFTIAAAFAQLERQTIAKRTKEGLAAAVKRGKILGRKPKLTDRQIRQAQEKLVSGSHSKAELSASLGVHPRTLSRAIDRLQIAGFSGTRH